MNGSNRDFDAILLIAARAIVDNEANEFFLCNDGQISYPDHLDRKIIRKIKDHTHGRKHTRLIRSIRNVAAVFFAICTLTIALGSSIEGNMKGLWDYTFEKSDSRIEINLETDDIVPTKIEESRCPSIYPEHLVEKKMLQNSAVNSVFYYEKQDDNYTLALVFTQYNLDSSKKQFFYLSEECEIYNIFINNTEGILLLDVSGENRIIWHDKEYVYSLTSKDGRVYLDYLIEMAESVN